MKGLLTALRTLTILPLPGQERNAFSASLPWFPVAGFFIGAVLYWEGVLWTNLLSLETEIAAAFLLLTQIILTRGLHLDGLADWADAVGGNSRKEKRLEIMKDPHLGTFGVLALVMALILKWLLFKCLLSGDLFYLIVPVSAVSRSIMVELITVLPYARREGGTALPFVEGAILRHRILSQMITFVFVVFFGFIGIMLQIAGYAAGRLLGFSFRRSFGGVTGDLLGTANEVVEFVLLSISVVLGPTMLHAIQ